uniref:Protein kinase domain-containing protein n=1 Tax=Catagonus wagneri TaxID=51154 RepID=A0A8C3WXG6_9CETA
PEVLKSEPYGEKADVWAAGCILYQMATLNPPFYSTNMLSLATKIVEAVYDPVPEGIYSEKVTTTISRCLTPDAEARPDIVEVSSMISDVMMKYLDTLSTSQLALERKLDRERRRTQRYFTEANRNAVTCQRELALLSHETFEKASLSSSSSGAGSLKSELSESVELPPEAFQAPCIKDEDQACDGLLSDYNFNLENVEKDIYSELDDELDISDELNSSSSSSSPLKESTFSKISFPVCGILASGGLGITLGTSAGIAVSQRKVRQISDPIQQILIQLHKVIYITQLPPALHHNLKRRVVERFKKSLFSQQSNPCNLKSEIKKLSQGSPEPIEPNFFTADYHLLHRASGGHSLSPSDPTGNSLQHRPSGFHKERDCLDQWLSWEGYFQYKMKIEEFLSWLSGNESD